MINWIIMFLVSHMVHAAPVPSYPAPVISPVMLEQVKKETVLISLEGWQGVGRGTGVLIDSTHVLTCAHMLGDGEFWVFTYPKGRVLGALPVFADKEHDLAILELSEPVKLSQYAIFQSSTTIGQPIVVIGNTLGSMKWFTSYGIISEKEFFYDLTTATAHGGNSGGPWLDLQGQVVALTDWGLQNKGHDEGISGGIDGATIEKFLKEWKTPNPFQILFGGN